MAEIMGWMREAFTEMRRSIAWQLSDDDEAVALTMFADFYARSFLPGLSWMKDAAEAIYANKAYFVSSRARHDTENAKRRIEKVIAESYARRPTPAGCEEVAREILAVAHQGWSDSHKPKVAAAIIARFVTEHERPLREAVIPLLKEVEDMANALCKDGDPDEQQFGKDWKVLTERVRNAVAASQTPNPKER